MTARKQIILAAYFPGVNNTTVWSDPESKSQIEFESFEHLAKTAERGKLDFFFLAEGLRLREQRRQDPRPRHRRAARHPHRARRAGRHHHPPRPGRHPQRHVPRALRAGPPAGHPRPAVGRPGGVERGHLVGRLHRRELPPRRVPRPRRPLQARRRVHRRVPPAVGLVGGRRGRGRSRRRDVRAPRRARRLRAPRAAVRHPRPLQRAPQPAGAPRHPAGGRQRRGAGAGGGVGRRHLHPALDAARGPGASTPTPRAAWPSTAAAATS